MKKTAMIISSLLLNIFLAVISIAFYAKDEFGEVAKGTTDVPIILFLIGCYLVPWYFVNKRTLSNKMNRLTIALFSGSFLFMWTLLAMTGGFFTTFLNFLSFFMCFVVPFALFHFFRINEPTIQMEAKKEYTPSPPVVKKETPNTVSLHAIETIVQAISDTDVKKKGEEILTLLRTILKNEQTLDTEEQHIIKRLIDTDLAQLLQPYLKLNVHTQDEIEPELLNNLDIIVTYLHSIIDGVSNEYLTEMKTSMHLIEQRYKK